MWYRLDVSGLEELAQVSHAVAHVGPAFDPLVVDTKGPGFRQASHGLHRDVEELGGTADAEHRVVVRPCAFRGVHARGSAGRRKAQEPRCRRAPPCCAGTVCGSDGGPSGIGARPGRRRDRPPVHPSAAAGPIVQGPAEPGCAIAVEHAAPTPIKPDMDPADHVHRPPAIAAVASGASVARVV